MERNTNTTVSELEIGDRFYRPTDKKKTVWEKVRGENKTTHFQTYKHFAIAHGMTFPVAMKKETIVIFLRHQNQPA